MFQREALWISFANPTQSNPGSMGLGREGVVRQVGFDYNILLPPLDSDLRIQFVAMPLGKGYTVEEQVTGKAIGSSLQFDVFPVRRSPSNCFIRYQDGTANLVVETHQTPDELTIPDGTKIEMDMYGVPLLLHRRWQLTSLPVIPHLVLSSQSRGCQLSNTQLACGLDLQPNTPRNKADIFLLVSRLFLPGWAFGEEAGLHCARTRTYHLGRGRRWAWELGGRCAFTSTDAESF